VRMSNHTWNTGSYPKTLYNFTESENKYKTNINK
jgi:hypothetical protein